MCFISLLVAELEQASPSVTQKFRRLSYHTPISFSLQIPKMSEDTIRRHI